MEVQNGVGTDDSWLIDKNNRGHVFAITEDVNLEATDRGDSYNINSGILNLTTSGDSACLYFRNDESTDYHITAIAVGLGEASGTKTKIPMITVVRNPTAGTIIDDATAVAINSNRNFGSNKTLGNSIAYKGGEGKTFTDGSDHLLFFQNSKGRLFASIDEVLPKGSSIGVKIKPEVGNTDMDCYVALIGYLTDPRSKNIKAVSGI